MKSFRQVVLVLLLVAFLLPFSKADVFGANLNEVGTGRGPADSPGYHDAIAGNVTEIGIVGRSNTRAWAGYFGNVSGTIQLSDSSNNIMYNWSLANPEGEVYASTNGTGIIWTSVQCFNFTATGQLNPSGETPGQTNQKGLNLTQLHQMYNIKSDDVDRVDNTFSLTGTHESGVEPHREFVVGSINFTAGRCLSTNIFANSGAPEAGKFQEVLLYEPNSNSVIFTSLIHENSVLGFDNRDHDFQMLVLEDGHGTNVATTRYYFYVELE